MKVKVGEVWFDSGQQPLAVIVSEDERDQIGQLDESALMYVSFPTEFDSGDALRWADGTIGYDEIKRS